MTSAAAYMSERIGYTQVDILDKSCDAGTHKNGSDAVGEAVNTNSSEEASSARHNEVFWHICRILLLQYDVYEWNQWDLPSLSAQHTQSALTRPS